MASSLIKLPITVDVLYEGDKWTTGSKMLNYDWTRYDYLVIKLRTNVEYFTRTLPVYHGLLAGNPEFFSQVAFDTSGSAGWLYSGLFLSGASDGSVNVSVNYSNSNWIMGIIKIIGIKIN